MSGRNSSLWKNQQKRSVLGLSLHCISWTPSYLLTLVDNIYILLFTLNEWNLLSFSRQGALPYVFKKKKRKRKPFLLFKIDTAKKPNNIFTSNWNLSLNEKELLVCNHNLQLNLVKIILVVFYAKIMKLVEKLACPWIAD